MDEELVIQSLSLLWTWQQGSQALFLFLQDVLSCYVLTYII